MASIKLGNYGNYVPEGTSPTARVQPGVRVGEGLQALGDALIRKGQQKEAERKQALDAQATVARANYDSSLNQLQTDLLDKEAKGEITADQLDAAFKDEAHIRREQLLGAIPEDSRDKYRPFFDISTIKATDEFLTAQRGRIHERRSGANQEVMQASLDQARKDPLTAIQTVDITVDGNKDLYKNPDETKRAFRDAAWTTNVTSQIEGAQRIDDMRKLKNALNDDKQYPGLEGVSRTKLMAHADARIRELKATFDADERGTRAQADFNAKMIADRSADPAAFVPGEREQYDKYLAALPDNVPNKKKAQLALSMSTDLKAMAQMRSAERDKIVSDAQQAIGAAGTVPARVEAIQRYEILNAATDRFNKQIADNPVRMWEAQTGESWPTWDAQAPAAEQMRANVDRAADAAGRTGVNPGLVRPEASKAVAVALKSMEPGEAAKFFSDLTSPDPVTGHTVPQEMVDATIATIGRDDSVVASAMQYGVHNARVNGTGEFIAPRILRGARDIEAGNVKVNSEEFDKAFDRVAGNAYSGFPDARRRDMDAAKAYWATLNDTDKKADKRNGMEYATQAVLGAKQTINGQSVFAPVGMDGADFTSMFHAELSKQLKARGWDDNEIEAANATAKPFKAGWSRYGIIYNGAVVRDLAIDVGR